MTCGYVSWNKSVCPVQHFHEVAPGHEQGDVAVPGGDHLNPNNAGPPVMSRIAGGASGGRHRGDVEPAVQQAELVHHGSGPLDPDLGPYQQPHRSEGGLVALADDVDAALHAGQQRGQDVRGFPSEFRTT